MVVLGIDPGTAICGYGVIEVLGNRLRAIDHGVVRTSVSLSTVERLKSIHEGISNLISTYAPDLMAVEQLFFNKNVQTAMAVGQARGVVLLSGAQANLEVLEFTPLQVKQSVVGYGKATKEQVILMTQRILNLSCKPSPDDAADALAVAICAAHVNSAGRVWRGDYK